MGLQRPGFLNVEALPYGVDNMIKVRVNTQRVGIRLHSSACDPSDHPSVSGEATPLYDTKCYKCKARNTCID